MKKIISIVVGFLFMVAALILFVKFQNGYEKDVTTMKTLMPNRFVQSGETITFSMLREVMIPKVAHNPKSYLESNDVVGKTAVAPISPDEELASWKITNRVVLPKEGEHLFGFDTNSIENVSNMLRRGDRVDVWVELKNTTPVTNTDSGVTSTVASVKVLENVLVGNVKSGDGKEITDSSGSQILSALSRDGDVNQYRVTPSATASSVNLILNDDQYGAYIVASLTGKIKFSLPNPYKQYTEDTPSKITDAFSRLRVTPVFKKSDVTKTINVSGINASDVKGILPDSTKKD